MSNRKAIWEPVSPDLNLKGGRGLTATIINREVLPSCHPLDGHNMIVIASGLLGGSIFPSSGRLSAGFKSPLTGGIKESNIGGNVGQKLARLGIKALIIEGRPPDGEFYTIRIGRNDVSLLTANDLTGLGNYEVVNRLKRSYGDDVGILSIGPPGERKASSATIAGTDMNGMPSRHCGRGGGGAVMGAKGIKAIVIDDTGTDIVTAKNTAAAKEIVQHYSQFLADSKSAHLVRSYGQMGGLVWISDQNHSLPVRNFTSGMFENAADIGGKKAIDYLVSRGSKWGVSCMPGCLQRCSNIIRNDEGEYITSGLEYEQPAMLGANLGIDNIWAICNMSRLDDDYGLDDIEIGATLGLAMQAGVLEFGDSEGAIGLIHEIAQATTLGRILGGGAVVAARTFGISRVPAVKGQSLGAHDPRVENARGVAYCTSPMGADHTAANTVFRQPTPESAISVSRQAQINVAMLDCLGLCQNAYLQRAYPVEKIADMVQAQTGIQFDCQKLQAMGRSVLIEERAFNLSAGFSAGADRLPLFFREEPLPPSNYVFDIPDHLIDSFWFNDLS